MRRGGDGAWVERARAFAARRHQLLQAGATKPFDEIAKEAGVSAVTVRRYLDGLEMVRPFEPALSCRLSLNGIETLRILASVDPGRYSEIRNEALTGHFTLAELQAFVEDARVRSAATPLLHLPINAIVKRFLGADALVNRPPLGEPWLLVAADVSGPVPGGRHHEWALVMSPLVVGSPLVGRPFADFLLRVAAAAGIYDRVGAFCASSYEAERVSERSAVWWPYGAHDRLTVLHGP